MQLSCFPYADLFKLSDGIMVGIVRCILFSSEELFGIFNLLNLLLLLRDEPQEVSSLDLHFCIQQFTDVLTELTA